MNPHKWLLAAAAVLHTSLAYAGCSVGALPFNLQNNTLADATQVMANFNQITTGANSNCAAAGANDDITSLSALVTPIAPSQGGTAVFAGGTTSGGPNAQSVTVNSNWSSSVQGYHVTGFWGATNTAPLTLSVNGGTPLNVYRKNQFGVSSTYGGEAIQGHPFDLISNGSGILINITETIYIGEMKIAAYNATPGVPGGTLPPGWLVADGSSFVCTTYQDLCNVIGNTFGGSASNPNLPDTRGRVMTGFDSYGTGIGAAGRLTNAGTGCGSFFTFLGATCANANQSHTQIVAELAVHNHSASSSSSGSGSGNVTDPGHAHNQNASTYYNIAGTNLTTGGVVAIGQQTAATASNTTGLTVPSLNLSISTTTTVNNNGSSQAMPIVNPNLAVVMLIRF